mgnify:CR=1 FL=1
MQFGKKLWCVVGCASLVGALHLWPGISAQSAVGDNTKNRRVIYQGDTYAVEMEHPSAWSEGRQMVAFTAPMEPGMPFLENVNLLVEDISGLPSMALPTYIAQSKANLATSVVGFSVESEGRTQLSDLNAHYMVYTGWSGVIQLKYFQVLALKGDKGYVLTYTAEVGQYDPQRADVRACMDSVVIR